MTSREEMQAAFVANNGEKVTDRDRREEAFVRKHNMGRTKPLEPGKPPKKETFKTKLLNAKWSGIREAFFYLAHRYEPDGRAHCEECGVAGDEKTLQLHHLRRRGQGGEYAARNAALLCDLCHKAADGNDLRWTGGDPRD